MVPRIFASIKGNPLSLNFFVQCYIRCLMRPDHLTFSNEDPKKLLKLLVVFFQTFKDQKFDSNFVSKFGFDKLLEADFTTEHEDLQLPANLDKALKSLISCQDIMLMDPLISEVVRLIDLYRSLF